MLQAAAAQDVTDIIAFVAVQADISGIALEVQEAAGIRLGIFYPGSGQQTGSIRYRPDQRCDWPDDSA